MLMEPWEGGNSWTLEFGVYTVLTLIFTKSKRRKLCPWAGRDLKKPNARALHGSTLTLHRPIANSETDGCLFVVLANKGTPE